MITTDVLIIGAGPGGYVAALRAAQLGKKVTIVEKAGLGGTCLNDGCIPSKALIEASHYAVLPNKAAQAGVLYGSVSVDFGNLQDWKNSIVHQLTSGVEGLLISRNVSIIKGEASFLDPYTVSIAGERETLVSFSNCIIASGSKPVNVPSFPFGDRILSSTEALSLNEKPSSLAIIGGGYIGIELGTVFANFGTQVTMFEGMNTILSGFSEDMSSLVYNELAAKDNVTIHTNAKVNSIERKSEEVVIEAEVDGDLKKANADYALVTVGRKPNTDQLQLEKAGVHITERGYIPIDTECRTNKSHIFAIGDITPGQALAHRASLQGKMAAEAINGDAIDATDYVIPAVVFSDPPLAVVGPSEAELNKAGWEFEVHKFPFNHNGRALTLREDKGFVKLMIDPRDQTILSAEVAGQGAPELINELSLSIQSGLTAEDVSLVVHAHPTLGESILEAADKAIGFPVHSL
ncbi:dihydrolipoyl dehydrogenase [Halobacillus sp. Marseille-Q1614]|uniref:dihydrolipoyl dehydrogenase n=1 Tax=Halobacillus sp. Marseille-Q1614 TaxID=2709134 RepID=UPI00156E9BBB|nr:dihydrolipoyl dehydrogenase [Halobacillus sp. Marseille-Q1614]